MSIPQLLWEQFQLPKLLSKPKKSHSVFLLHFFFHENFDKVEAGMLYLSDPSEFGHRNDSGDHEKAIDSYKPITVDFFFRSYYKANILKLKWLKYILAEEHLSNRLWERFRLAQKRWQFLKTIAVQSKGLKST